MVSCDVCKLDNVVQEATYFCCDCKDYMCEKCESYHKKVKLTRLHTVKPSNEMLTDTEAKTTLVTGAEGTVVQDISSTTAEADSKWSDSTPAEDDFDWEATEAEEYILQSDIATRAEELLSLKDKPTSNKIFLNAKLSPHTKMNNISVKHPLDKYEPLVTGLAFLTSGELLVTDYNNKYLKLLDKSLKLKQTLECPGIPYGVAIINDKEAIVTFPLQRNVVQFLSLSPKLSLGKCVPMNNGCWGVTVSNNKIFIACNANGHREEVIVMDTAGKILKVIDVSRLVGQFGDLKHITANSSGNKIYLSGTSKILCMTPEGQRVFTCVTSAVDVPRGIIIDDYDNALVSCQGSNKVLVMKADGKKSRPLLTAKHGIQDPKAIAYRDEDGLLVIGGWRKYNLLALQIN